LKEVRGPTDDMDGLLALAEEHDNSLELDDDIDD